MKGSTESGGAWSWKSEGGVRERVWHGNGMGFHVEIGL